LVGVSNLCVPFFLISAGKELSEGERLARCGLSGMDGFEAKFVNAQSFNPGLKSLPGNAQSDSCGFLTKAINVPE